jgi:hypothetical protein
MLFNQAGDKITLFNRNSKEIEKEIEMTKQQYKSLGNKKFEGDEEKKRIEEMETIIDLLSNYGNQGVSAMLELFPNTNASEIRTYGYRKIEQMKQS